MTTTTRMVIAACTARKTATTTPIPAFDLYQGSVVPQLRDRLGAEPYRKAVFFLSAKHGFITADAPITFYDQRLDLPRALQLRDTVANQATQHIRAASVDEVLLIAEPLYLALLTPVLTRPSRPTVHWSPDVRNWPKAARILDRWGW